MALNEGDFIIRERVGVLAQLKEEVQVQSEVIKRVQKALKQDFCLDFK